MKSCPPPVAGDVPPPDVPPPGGTPYAWPYAGGEGLYGGGEAALYAAALYADGA